MHNISYSFRAARLLLLASLIFLSYSASSQNEGCTDPQALNYNPGATWNDGSCYYAVTNHSPEPYVDLPSSLNESSGLIYYSEGIWTFNDSEGEPVIFKVDTLSGNILQEVTISNGNNTDWEDIAQDEDYIYVGDFGNNAGNRKDLAVYKIDKADIPSTGNATVTAEIIAYSYADQEDFTTQVNNNEYDCEAMISSGGKLYLFTKNWVSETSRLYELPAEPGTYDIWPVDTLNVEGLVTGAAYSEELGQIVLSGYRYYVPFIFLLFDYHDDRFFSGNKRKIGLSGVFGAQTEGICFKKNYQTLLSCEASAIEQQVFTINTAQWTDTSFVRIEEPDNKIDIKVRPNPVEKGELFIDGLGPDVLDYSLAIYNSTGVQVPWKEQNHMRGTSIQSIKVLLPEAPPGLYLLHIYSGDLYATQKIIIP